MVTCPRPTASATSARSSARCWASSAPAGRPPADPSRLHRARPRGLPAEADGEAPRHEIEEVAAADHEAARDLAARHDRGVGDAAAPPAHLAAAVARLQPAQL